MAAVVVIVFALIEDVLHPSRKSIWKAFLLLIDGYAVFVLA